MLPFEEFHRKTDFIHFSQVKIYLRFKLLKYDKENEKKLVIILTNYMSNRRLICFAMKLFILSIPRKNG